MPLLGLVSTLLGIEGFSLNPGLQALYSRCISVVSAFRGDSPPRGPLDLAVLSLLLLLLPLLLLLLLFLLLLLQLQPCPPLLCTKTAPRMHNELLPV
jgi:hypothetical protein